MQPLATKQTSFIKDTTDLLDRIQKLNEQGPFPENTLLVSMFPNIDNELGLGAVSRALDTREQLLPTKLGHLGIFYALYLFLALFKLWPIM